MNIYWFLDYFFLFFHSALIVFNLFGWILKKTRKLHWVVLGSTLFSWFIMGYFYGWGYCILTDWHWDVLAELGKRPAQSVYVQYLLDRIFNWEVSRSFSDILTVSGLIFGLLGAVFSGWYTKKQVNSSKTT